MRQAVIGFALLASVFTASSAMAAGDAVAPIERHWNHDGALGTFDRGAVQRGFQVYKEVCASCHGLDYLEFRTLGDIGFNAAEIKAIAAEYTVIDGPNDEGEMFERNAKPFDSMPGPYPNEQASRASNGGAYPPDLSLITKARPNGVNYVYSLMVGYDENQADSCSDGSYYNAYFAGHCYAMPQPLYGDDVEYSDGTNATIEQAASDVAQFLHWVAEPKLEERKLLGLIVMIFLIIMTALLFAYKRRIWSKLH